MRLILSILVLTCIGVNLVGCGAGQADPDKAAEIRKQQMAGETAEDKASHD